MTMTDHYAVFGHPIGHSKSPRIHHYFAKQTGHDLLYTAQDVSPQCFETALRTFHAGGGKGLNCTVPLKEPAFRLADEVSPRASLCEAVNTLYWREDRLHGDNTDGVGLVRDLSVNLGIPLQGRRLLILGAGGAARGIVGPLLEKAPREIVIANRTLSRAEELAERFSSHGPVKVMAFAQLAGQQFELIVNATSASLQGDLPPIPNGVLAPGGCCYDLMYSEQPTAFVQWGEAQGARLSIDGLGMLVEQAAEAFFLWRGVRPATSPVIEKLRGRPSG